MKFICEKKDVNEIIMAAGRILPEKGMKPEESAILISATEKGVEFECTDSAIRMRSHCPAEVSAEGKCLVTAHVMASIMNTYGDGKVEFEKQDNSLWMRRGKAKTKFQVIDPTLFPGNDKAEDMAGEFKISQKKLKEMLVATHYAAATTSDRPELTGIVISLNKKKVETVGIDGYRMSSMSESVETELEGKYIVPIKTVKILIYHLKDEGDVTIKVSDNKFIFEMGDMTITTALLQGKAIDSEKVFPSKKDTAILINCDDLASSIMRASIVSSKRPVILKITDDLTGKFLRIQSESESGAFDEEIEIEMTGVPMDLKFNPLYLISALKHINRPQCIMEFQKKEDKNQSCVIKAGDDASKHLVLPVAS